MHGVGAEAQLRHLLLHFAYVVRMAVANADDGMAAVEVEVGLAFAVPHLAALAFHNFNVEKGIYGKKVHVVSFLG